MSKKLILVLAVFSLLSISALAEILELKSDASENDIKKAFRKLSAKYHPDKNQGNDEAHKKYVEINKAYEILNDPEKRQIYDLRGLHGLEEHLQGGGQMDVWGNRRGQPRGPNAHAEIPVDLAELYNGAVKEMSMQKNVICNKCRGTGAKDGQTTKCKSCGGKGVKMQKVSMGPGMTMQMQTHCDVCGGKGITHAESCPICRGRKVLPTKKTLIVQIEKGMKDGQELVFARESEQSPDYMPGDVIFTLRQQPHSTFKREGNDLHTDLTITLKEAITGFSKRIRHLDGHYTEVSSNEIIQPFQVKRIPGQGMPIHGVPSQFGDMHVRFIVELPKKLTQADKEILEKVFEKKA
eukprot:CAMPEP_0176424888 /NCGR_PEP_ID=MMETSP0127-20121128/11088_1 /TAXON_ID=938130 /ORGANISM="Platyophrya macrostoma, Strain WH" /LENGTH=350 /DNA_ID=CAMNT_0017805997 /DNA_START=32 /DNA_END=1084 /DNA_ORIENTATION=-